MVRENHAIRFDLKDDEGHLGDVGTMERELEVGALPKEARRQVGDRLEVTIPADPMNPVRLWSRRS
jgi:hypothetical protein